VRTMLPDTIVTKVTPLPEVAADALSVLNQRWQDPQTFLGLPSGFLALDDLLCGFRRGTVTILCGPPGVGKTAFVTSIIVRNCIWETLSEGQRILMLPLEMGAESWLLRIVSMWIKIPQADLERGLPTKRLNLKTASFDPIESDQLKAVWTEVEKVFEKIASWPVDIWTASDCNTFLIHELLEEKRQEGVDYPLIILDYVEQLSDVGETESSTAKVDFIITQLANFAKQYDTAILAIWPMTKEGMKATRPRFSSLRQSAMPLYSADTILMMSSPQLHGMRMGETDVAQLPPKIRVDIRVDKARISGGSLGTASLWFYPPIGLFNDLEPLTSFEKDRYKRFKLAPKSQQVMEEGGNGRTEV